MAGKREDYGAVAVTDREQFGAIPVGQDASPDPGSTFTRGAYSGLANVAGAPVDLITSAINANIRRPMMDPSSPFFDPTARQIEQPVGGSDFLRRQLGRISLPSGTSLTYPSLESLPQSERPVAVAGEIMGGGLPLAFAPPLAAAGGAMGPQALRPVMEAARARPGAFLATETAGLAGAAQGGAMAELLAPGNPMARFGGEVAGGFMNPVGAIFRALRGATTEIKSVLASMTPAGRQAKTAQILQKALQEAGEDPEALVAALRQSGLTKLTAGQKTGSPTLLAMEARLAKQSGKFSTEAQKRSQEGLSSLREMTDFLESSGDPALLRSAARIREQYFNGLLEGRLRTAQAEATETAARLSGRSDASRRTTEIIESSLDEARKAEGELWSKVDGTATTRPQNIVQRYDELRATLLKEEKIDPIVDAVIKRLTKTQDVDPMAALTGAKQGEAANTVTVQELRRVRSRMLALARESRSKQEWDKARQYGEIAHGALDDLSTVAGKEADEARTFSRNLNDTFSRTFAGDVTETDVTGARRIHPDMVLERAFGGGGVGAKVRLGELQSAAEFSGFGVPMLTEQEQFLRSASRAVIDPQTGRVNPRQLERFIQDNEAVLQRFPGLRRDLADASTAEQAFRDVEGSTKTASTQIKRRAAFAQLMEYEDPSSAIGATLQSKTPERSFSQIVNTAKRAGPGAVGGLRASAMDYAAKQATDAQGNFSFTKYRQALMSPVNQNGPSLLEMMTRQGVMPRAHEVRLQRIMGEASRIEAALANRARMDELIDAPDALVDFVTRVAGANLGGASALGQISGAPLVAAGAGSKYMRQLFQKVPRTRLQDVLIEAAENPEFMASLLQKPQNAQQARQLERQINAFLIQAGITYEREK